MIGPDCCCIVRPVVIFPSELSLTRNPVHGNALHPADAISDHVLPPCLIPLGSTNGAQAHVHPIDGVILCEEEIALFYLLHQRAETPHLSVRPLASMEIYPHSKGRARHWHQSVGFVRWVQRNAPYALVHRVQQERAHACSKHTEVTVSRGSFL